MEISQTDLSEKTDSYYNLPDGWHRKLLEDPEHMVTKHLQMKTNLLASVILARKRYFTSLIIKNEYLEDGIHNPHNDSLNVYSNVLEEIKQEADDDLVDDEMYDAENSSLELHQDLKEEYEWQDKTLDDEAVCKTQPTEELNKSKLKSQSVYNLLQQWCKKRNISKISEDILLEYYKEKSKSIKSSTLFAYFSMLRPFLITKENIDIGRYSRCVQFLRNNSKGYVSPKTKVFTKEQVQKFLKEAPDETYLMMKVALIIGISGGCIREELAQLTLDDIEDLGKALIIKLTEKSKFKRSFTVIPENESELNCLEIFRKYISLRPSDGRLKTRRLFLSYRSGKCYPQVVGINSFGKIPIEIAKYLQLPESNSYNGHCFKRTALSLAKN